MKIRTIKYASILGTALSLAAPGIMNAATVVWDGGGDGTTFTDNLNWTGDVLPADDTTTDVAQLIGGTINLTGNRSAYGLDLITAPTSLTGAGTTFTVGGDASGGGLTGDQNLTLNDTNTLSLLGTDGDAVNFKYSQNYTGDITIGAGSSILSQRFGLRLDTVTHANTTITLDGGKIEAAGGNHLEVYGREINLTSNGGILQHAHARNIYGFSTGTGVLISGPGQLTLRGANTTAGRIQLDSTNTYTGGTRIEQGGQAWAYSDASFGDLTTGITMTTGGTLYMSNGFASTRPIVLEGDGRISGNTLTYNGGVDGITGPGSLTFTGGSEHRFAGSSDNTYSGGTIMDGAGIRLDTETTLGTGDITLMNGGYIKNDNSSFTVTKNILVDATGGGIESGWSNKRITVTGLISGDGELTIQDDSSEVFLNNAGNTYAGGTKILAKLAAENAGSLGTGPLTFDGGSLRNDNSNIDLGTRDITIEAGGAEIQVGWTNRRIAMEGVVSGPGAITVLDDSSFLRLLNSGNTYSGGTEIRGFVNAVSGGLGTGAITLNDIEGTRGQLQNWSVGDATLPNDLSIDPDNGGRLKAGWNNDLKISGVVSGVYNEVDLTHGLTIEGDSGWVVFDNPANTLGAHIFLPDATSKIRVASLGNGTVSGDFNGETSGLGEIDFAIGSGTQAISYPLAHTGGTTISSGTVNLKYDGEFVSDVSLLPDTAVLKLGGTLDLLNGTHSEVVGSTTLLAGKAAAVTQTGGTATLQMGAITVEPGASIDFGAENIATTTNINTNGILGPWATIAGTDFAANDGSGNIIAFTGYTDVERLDGSGPQSIADGATTQVRIVEGSGSPADITLGAALTTIDTLSQSASGGTSAATIDLSTNALAVNSILVDGTTGGLTLNNGTLQSAGTALSLNNGSTTTINSVIADGTGASDFNKSGAGNLELTGTNTYTGTTNVNTGTVKVTADNENTAVNIAAGATLELDFNNRWGATTTISGDGSLVKTGASTIDFEAVNFALGSGALIDIQAGTFVAGSSTNENWSSNLSDLNVASGATFRSAEENVFVDALTGDGTIQNGYSGAGYVSMRIGVANGSGTFNGIITDDVDVGSLEKLGAGTQTLTGANTYSGTTTISGGILQIDNNLGLQNTVLDTAASAAGNAGTGLRAGAGVVTPTIGGLSGDKDLASVFTTSTGGAELITGLTLNPGATTSVTYSGAITDTFAALTVTKTGDGTQVLSGALSYTGDTTANAGTLELLDTKAGTNNYIANSTGTLSFNTTGTVQLDAGTISGDGTFLKTGAGTLLIGANGSTQAVSMSAGGLIDVQGGTLRNEYSQGDWSANLASLNVAVGATVNSWDSPGGITVDALTGGGTVTHTNYGAPNNLTVGINNGSGTFSGLLTDDVARILNLVKSGTGTQTIDGSSTLSGNITVQNGALTLADGGSITFYPTSNGTTNFVEGITDSTTGTVNLDGSINLDLSGTDTTPTNAWIIVDATNLLAVNYGATFTVTSTEGSFSEETSGVWTLDTDGNLWTFTEASGTLTVAAGTPPSGYGTWAGDNGLTEGVNDGETDDPEFDGIENVLEYILGGNPLVADLSILPTSTINGANLELSFTRSDDSEADATTSVQFGSDLTTFPTVTEIVPASSGAVGSVTFTIIENGDGDDDVTASIPHGGATEFFGRVTGELDTIPNK